jgi:hypothetical protein
VTSAKGIFEFLLGGSVDTKLLEVRVFDTKVKRAAYAKQTQAAEGKGESNCPLCAIGHNANKSRIYKFDEMDADHVAAWSKGGGSSAKNCQMLCITHNRAKGNPVVSGIFLIKFNCIDRTLPDVRTAPVAAVRPKLHPDETVAGF